jgi:hypothetical protein
MKQFTSFYTYPNFTLDDNAKVGINVQLPKDSEKIREVIYEYASDRNWVLRISRDGLIQFKEDEIEKEIEDINESWKRDLATAKSFDYSWLKYLEICNLVHLCFECCMHDNGLNLFGFEYQTLSYGDITRVTYDSNDIPMKQASYRGGGTNKLMRYGSYLPDEIKKLAIPTSAINHLCSYYLENLLKDDLSVQLVVKVGQSLNEHNTSNWSSSIVISWFVTEWYIGKLWDDFIQSKSITGNRKKLLNSRDYTASIIVEHLQLHQIIDDAQYEKVSKLRKLRNKIAHEFIDASATKQDSIEGLDLCKWVLLKITGLNFTFNTQGFSTHGL